MSSTQVQDLTQSNFPQEWLLRGLQQSGLGPGDVAGLDITKTFGR